MTENPSVGTKWAFNPNATKDVFNVTTEFKYPELPKDTLEPTGRPGTRYFSLKAVKSGNATFEIAAFFRTSVDWSKLADKNAVMDHIAFNVTVV